MCGICGIVGAGDRETIERMTRSIAHRGPDGGGVELFPAHALALGHRRLSIIDLSARGRQPMANEDDSLWISFNGEIYNFQELRRELDPGRHRFRSETDTEVILHLFEERGVEAFRRLNGMFAFALYDAARERLHLVRDHLGVKPLYYADVGGRLIFGSEIKAILASEAYSPEIDRQSMRDFFSYLYVPAPRTIFRDIRQLPPAHWLEYDLARRRIVRVERYWGPKFWEAAPPMGPGERRQALRELFGDAVGRQMISDVPLGAFLSGGVDSNVIVGLMAERTSRPVKTFTVRFDEPGMDYYDERREARRISEKFATEHHELPIDLSRPEEMLDLIESFDQPFGNTTFFLTWLLSRYTRESVTVALSGAGGDELFGGYPRYRAVQQMRALRLLPRPLARAALWGASRLRDDFADRRLHRVRALLAGLDRDPARQYLKWVYYLDEDRKAKLLRNDDGLPAHRILQAHLDDAACEWPEMREDGNRFSYLDTETFLPDNLLEYSDKMSMAWALELRVPFLDPRMVEFAFRVPFAEKLNRRGSKMILREAFADLIPPENLRVPKKGFNVPLGAWMRTKLDRYFDELLPRDYVEREGLFHYDYITHLREEHRSGRRDNAYELFSILIFDAWYRKYITRTLPRKEEYRGSGHE
ncbi:MAG: asparagine synthase (glutamine-hydrolyzing) [Blastocatellia bacterium]|nr:asparagine synthase (glutamine-hydrolyzing) [Blastocatellia bacterium]